ncbi:GNAT family N-acetyltransferase [Persicirhabdus sediminis]|uniref:GNAT family N-acetyltransferase n=1 Tax=Persicirhabdus sediminis TaxID=454144 RepID=A0A8J7MBQ6_9BACT|nr:GNAT family N-acetyltransferase [Persicirhabdus sediminis]MBK1789556.1 GNAT family N-acetyltransferase [Persicirhabdus sediminis]
MLTIQKLGSQDSLAPFKNQYLQETTAPLDGMWLDSFVADASFFGIHDQDQLVGYYCVNEDGYILQFYLQPDKHNQAHAIFATILNNEDRSLKRVVGAYASTAEPNYLSTCLDHFTKFQPHTLMYQLGEHAPEIKSPLTMVPLRSKDLAAAVDFAHQSIGANKIWLESYFDRLISRQELYGYWQNNELIATGECRAFDDHQSGYADLGLIIAENHRGEGLGTQVMCFLAATAKDKGLKPICSTEKAHFGAQRAISKAGFVAHNRIIKFDS